MVDWASQDRLYPPGYRPTDVRRRRTSIDSSLPYSISPNKCKSRCFMLFFLLIFKSMKSLAHNCRIRTKQREKIENNEVPLEKLRNTFLFFDDTSTDATDDR